MHEKCEEKTNEATKSNNTFNYVLLGVVSMLFVGSVLQAMTIGQVIGDLKQGGVSLTGLSASNAAGGETQAQMMARMHPDQVQQQAAASAGGSGNGQVGGC